MSHLNRRDFIRKFFRFGLAGGIVVIGYNLGTRSSDTDSTSGICSKPSPCQQCGQFNGCTQPRALAEIKKTEIKSDSLHIAK
jgi:hypothetical protein